MGVYHLAEVEPWVVEHLEEERPVAVAVAVVVVVVVAQPPAAPSLYPLHQEVVDASEGTHPHSSMEIEK